MDDSKKMFINNVFFQNAYQAGVNTRNKLFPVFNESKNESDLFKLRFYELIAGKMNVLNQINDSDYHIDVIEWLVNQLSKEFGIILFKNQIRFGIVQKVLNLYLKYLWCNGEISTPIHCPIDSVVRNRLLKINKSLLLPNWTGMDKDGYLVYLNAFESLGIQEIAEWELKVWNNKILKYEY